VRGRTILLVDDHAENRELLSIVLEHFGYEVVEAGDGRAGVQQARQRRPDLILMDVSMPVLDGLAATQLLKLDTATREIPVIAISAHDDPRVIAQCLAAGADGYLVKPTPPARVLKEVERWLPPADGTPRSSSSPSGDPGALRTPHPDAEGPRTPAA
jgi:two-component system, cell cycle response regulator DivK